MIRLLSVMSCALIVAVGCGVPSTLPATEDFEPRLTPIIDVQVLDGQTLDVSVDIACGDVHLEVEESDDHVKVSAWLTPSETWSEEASFQSDLTTTLSEALGRREFVVENPTAQLGRHVPCLHATGDQWCQELTLAVGDETQTVGLPELVIQPVDALIGDGVGTLELSDGTRLSVSTDKSFAHPVIYEERLLEHPSRKVWGSVVVHNINRSFRQDQAFDRDIAGFPAYLVTPAGAPHEPPQTLAVETGDWSVDVTFWSADTARHQEILDEFLDGLDIRRRPNQPPLVSDPRHLIGGVISLLVGQDDSYGFSFSPVPVCDTSPEHGCIPDVGFVGPGYHALPRIAGLPELRTPSRQHVDPLIELGRVEDLTIEVLDFGLVGELIRCTGNPAFDVDLLPNGPDRGHLHGEVEIYTGITNWRWRYLPGILTAYVGWPDAPTTVAIYERGDDGSWDTAGVTACE